MVGGLVGGLRLGRDREREILEEMGGVAGAVSVVENDDNEKEEQWRGEGGLSINGKREKSHVVNLNEDKKGSRTGYTRGACC